MIMSTINNISPILKIQDLRKSFGDNQVLNGFSMELFQSENLVIMGKSGSGKSVMIKCLVGLMQPDRGIIEIMGKDISQLTQNDLNDLRTEIGFLFQGSALYDSMTVRENLEFPLRKHKHKFKNEDIECYGNRIIRKCWAGRSHRSVPEELSGGMKRRVALARAIIMRPKIIIYDEPTTGLDPITAKEIINLMREIQEKYGTSSLIITHDVDCARVISNRMILLIDGINYAEGTFEELSTSSDKKIQEFFK